MKQSRSLRLASERLGELTSAELTAVAGGSVTTPTAHVTCPLTDALAALNPNLGELLSHTC